MTGLVVVPAAIVLAAAVAAVPWSGRVTFALGPAGSRLRVADLTVDDLGHAVGAASANEVVVATGGHAFGLYLPIALGECDPDHNRADVALALDTSSSMTGQKLEDAKNAAEAFIGEMDLAPGRDQVAVIRYDSKAELVCRLTTTRAVIVAAIRSLKARSGTHIDEGLRVSLVELQSPRHLERNLPVIVLLTDGIQTGTPGEDLRASEEIRRAGVRFYTIGLGLDVDTAALREMASDRSRYHFALGSAELARIYAEISADIPCPALAGGFWGARP